MEVSIPSCCALKTSSLSIGASTYCAHVWDEHTPRTCSLTAPLPSLPALTPPPRLFQGRLAMLGFLAAVVNEAQMGLGPVGQVRGKWCCYRLAYA